MAKRFHWYFPQNCTNFVSNSFSSRQNKQTNSSFDASAGKCKFVLLLYKILNIEEGHYKSELDRKIWKLGTKYISNLICFATIQFWSWSGATATSPAATLAWHTSRTAPLPSPSPPTPPSPSSPSSYSPTSPSAPPTHPSPSPWSS